MPVGSDNTNGGGDENIDPVNQQQQQQSHLNMQQELGLSAGGQTMSAPQYIPLEGRTPLRTPHRQVTRHSNTKNNYYNRTKRKRDSSWSSSHHGGHDLARSDSPPLHVTPLPPWGKHLQPYSKGVIGLHQEIEDFYEWIMPTRQEHYMRSSVVHRIEKCIKDIWSSAELHVFGSFKTGLYLPSSDIDLVVVGKWETLPLRTLEKALLDTDIADPATLKVLDKASVPIIKLTDKRSRVRVDVSFNMANGLKSVSLVNLYKERFPPLSKLICVLKQFLLQRDLNEVFTGGLSSYCLILMVVSFLQLHPRQDAAQHHTNLGVLLLEFLELYGRNFNYLRTAIRVSGGGSYVTKEEIQDAMPQGHRPSLLCIEDPLQPGNDVGKSSYGALQVRSAFDFAFSQLTRALHSHHRNSGSGGGPTLLSRIIQVDQATVEYRAWVRNTFPAGRDDDDEDDNGEEDEDANGGGGGGGDDVVGGYGEGRGCDGGGDEDEGDQEDEGEEDEEEEEEEGEEDVQPQQEDGVDSVVGTTSTCRLVWGCARIRL